MADTDSGGQQECVQRNGDTARSREQASCGNNVDGCSPTHLDLFSGIGGFALAAQWAGFRTIGFCELDKYCQKVLQKNFGGIPDSESTRPPRAGSEPQSQSAQQQSGDSDSEEGKVLAKNFLENTALVRNGEGRRRRSDNASQGQTVTEQPLLYSDIFDLDGTRFRGVDLITGGFPCQPFSVAGKRRGAADDRAIWPQMWRIIAQARPAWVLGENVPGIVPMELDNVLSDLEGIGYATRAFIIPACAVDARHRRDRLWIIGRLMGHAASAGSLSIAHAGVCGSEESGRPRDEESERRSLVITNRAGCEHAGEMQAGSGQSCEGQSDHRTAGGPSRWLTEPDVGRVAHGIHSRVDRLKGLGNAIVPQVAYEILREIRLTFVTRNG